MKTMTHIAQHCRRWRIGLLILALGATGCAETSAGDPGQQVRGQTSVGNEARQPMAETLAAVRLTKTPIIHGGLFADGKEGENINGPWLIRVPDWVTKPLGKYYLYFAHHVGQYIRMAYADSLTGPWKLYKPGQGVLHISGQAAVRRHIASPCVIVDEAGKRLVLYYHGPAEAPDSIPKYMRAVVCGQCTSVATSADGLSFSPTNRIVADFYLYPFEYEGAWYGLARYRTWWRTDDLLAPWQLGPRVLEQEARNTEPDIAGNEKNYAAIRHVAFLREGDRATVLFSCTGGKPERIFYAHVPLSGEWKTWRASGPARELLQPELPWEGAGTPALRSRAGAAPSRLYPAIQDPMVFTDRDGKHYLLYAGGGEKAIGIAELRWK